MEGKQNIRIIYLPLSSLKTNPINFDIYVEHGEDRLIEDVNLLESIKTEGLLEPLVVLKDGTIISGHRRYIAITSLLKQGDWPKDRELPCRYSVHANSTIELIHLNKYRIKTEEELELEWKVLEKELQKTIKQGRPSKNSGDKIEEMNMRDLQSQHFGESHAKTSQRIYVRKYDPELYDKVMKELVSLNQAYTQTKNRIEGKNEPKYNVGKKLHQMNENELKRVQRGLDFNLVSEFKGKQGIHSHPKTSFKEEFEQIWRKYGKDKGCPIEIMVELMVKYYPMKHGLYLKKEFQGKNAIDS